MPDDEIPRRARIDRYVPAETAIRAAIEAVEAMPADTRLTDAVVLLGKAKDRVADFVDGIQNTLPGQIHEFERTKHNLAVSQHELGVCREELAYLDATARELLDNARTHIQAVASADAAASLPVAGKDRPPVLDAQEAAQTLREWARQIRAVESLHELLAIAADMDVNADAAWPEPAAALSSPLGGEGKELKEVMPSEYDSMHLQHPRGILPGASVTAGGGASSIEHAGGEGTDRKENNHGDDQRQAITGLDRQVGQHRSGFAVERIADHLDPNAITTPAQRSVGEGTDRLRALIAQLEQLKAKWRSLRDGKTLHLHWQAEIDLCEEVVVDLLKLDAPLSSVSAEAPHHGETE